MPQTKVSVKNAANASHSTGSEPWNVVVPFTVATMPSMRIKDDRRKNTSSRRSFSGNNKRNPHAPVGNRIPMPIANIQATVEKSYPGSAYITCMSR